MAKLGTVIANLENLSESGALGATEDALQAEKNATDVAEGNAEMIKDVEEIDSVDTGISDAFDAADRVEELLDAAEETNAEGGLSDKEAKLMEISHESIMSSIGMSHRHTNFVANPVSSLESYASARTRQSATILTIEKLGDSIKTIAANIVKALKAALDTVVAFISGLLKNRTLLLKYIASLKARADAVDTAETSHKEEHFTGHAKALSVDGVASVATAGDLLQSAAKITTAVSVLAGEVASITDSEEAIQSVQAALQGKLSATNGRTLSVVAKGGNVEIKFDEGKTADKIEAPTIADIKSLLDQAKKVVEDLKNIEKSQSKFKDGVQKIIARLSEAGSWVRSKVGTAEGKEEQEYAHAAKKSARIARTILTKAGGSLPSAVFSAAKAVADYCAAGIRNYQKPAAK